MYDMTMHSRSNIRDPVNTEYSDQTGHAESTQGQDQFLVTVSGNKTNNFHSNHVRWHQCATAHWATNWWIPITWAALVLSMPLTISLVISIIQESLLDMVDYWWRLCIRSCITVFSKNLLKWGKCMVLTTHSRSNPHPMTGKESLQQSDQTGHAESTQDQDQFSDDP